MRDQHTARQWAIVREHLAAPYLSAIDKLVGIFLTDRIRRKHDPETGTPGGKVRIPVSGIAAALGISERAAQYSVARLKTAGHLAVDVTKWRGPALGRAHANTYTPLLKGDPQGSLNFPDDPTYTHGGASIEGPEQTTEYTHHGASMRNRAAPQRLHANGDTKGCTTVRVYPSDSVCKTKTEESFSKRESRRSLSAKKLPRSRSRGAVIPEGPTAEMEYFAQDTAGWTQEYSGHQYRLMVAHYAKDGKTIHNVEAAWRVWVERGIEHEMKRQQRQNSLGMPNSLRAAEAFVKAH
jgi:hypothetical protein